MSKMKSLVFAAAGAAGIYAGIEHYNGRFSDENIWTRQRPQIEAAARSERAPNPDSRFAALRAASADSPTSSGVGFSETWEFTSPLTGQMTRVDFKFED
jgi:hypothetical protein